ncbi:MAG: hypothetical protein KatS3mg105_1466 [Gemmatales bacterium]|nr:MAG: hypothetical protein KatS3mg105_1466 [Gemmatales bacterium]
MCSPTRARASKSAGSAVSPPQRLGQALTVLDAHRQPAAQIPRRPRTPAGLLPQNFHRRDAGVQLHADIAAKMDQVRQRQRAGKHRRFFYNNPCYNNPWDRPRRPQDFPMTSDPLQYDPRYLAGIVLFNRGDFFEAHEVWEDLWMETAREDRRFYQALIQAAVALCHFCNGNLRGAAKLYRSSHDYMRQYPSPHLGLDIDDFWNQMHACFADVLAADDPDAPVPVVEEKIPEIHLDPAPEYWPDPAEFLEES